MSYEVLKIGRDVSFFEKVESFLKALDADEGVQTECLKGV